MIPSKRSSCFSDCVKVVLTNPEKLSTVTVMIFFDILRMSTVNAWPGWSGISLGLKSWISTGILATDWQSVQSATNFLIFCSFSKIKNLVSTTFIS